MDLIIYVYFHEFTYIYKYMHACIYPLIHICGGKDLSAQTLTSVQTLSPPPPWRANVGEWGQRGGARQERFGNGSEVNIWADRTFPTKPQP